MSKIFLRTGAFYLAETKSLTDDLDITDLFSKQNIVATLKEETTFEKSISEFKKRIDDLEKKVNDTFFVTREIPESVYDKPAEVTSKKMVTKSTVAKKASKAPAKKK